MSQLRTVKHPDYHKAVSEVLENQVMPHLPSNVSIGRVFTFSRRSYN